MPTDDWPTVTSGFGVAAPAPMSRPAAVDLAAPAIATLLELDVRFAPDTNPRGRPS
jgi:hypothetical protein